MTCICVAQFNPRIKGHHVYGYKYTVNEELTCTIDRNNKYNSNAVKVLFLGVEKKKSKCNLTKGTARRTFARTFG